MLKQNVLYLVSLVLRVFSHLQSVSVNDMEYNDNVSLNKEALSQRPMDYWQRNQ